MKNLLLSAAKLALAGGVVVMASAAVDAKNNMSFFITSVGSGDGANLGGLAGADAHCAALAKAAGSTKTNWHAYLSTVRVKDTPPVDARDRIGQGPWVNARGVTIARNLDELYQRGNPKMIKANLLTEKGTLVNGAGDTPNTHDMLTGSDSAGRYIAPGIAPDTTCGNWTKNGDGSAVVGHFDGKGPNGDRNFASWTSAHASSGCGQEALVKTGGAGLFYCFDAG